METPTENLQNGPSRLAGGLEPDAELMENISTLIEEGREGMVMNILLDLHPADMASILSHLSVADARVAFHWLPTEQAGEVLSELDNDFRSEILEETTEARLTELIDELETDDAADVLADLPLDVADRVISGLEDADDVKELLAYDEETAGGLMATEYVAVGENWTVADATEEVRSHAETVAQIFVVFVVDEQNHLKGVVSLKKLLLSRSDVRIGDVTDTNIISAPTDMDQEDVARLMERYDLVSLPIVDAEGRLVGRVTIDDVVDVIREEAEEDIQRMSGVAGGEEHTDSVGRIARGRLPWLLAGLAGACLAAVVIMSFEKSLAAASILAAFIPIVMATAGNAGIQSSAIAVQGLASGDVWASDIQKRLTKEFLVAVLTGIAASAFLGGAILIFGWAFPGQMPDPESLALTASFALLLVIIMATSIGASIPLVLNRVGIDPALATGPFITTSNDILGILVFFLLANWLYL